jgi:hypothetical protein
MNGSAFRCRAASNPACSARNRPFGGQTQFEHYWRAKVKIAAFLPRDPKGTSMLRQTFTARTPLRSGAFALLCAVLVAFLPAGAARAENTVPDNATANSYNTGWKCDDGFQEQDDACIGVQLPDNAYLNNRSFGRGWVCMFGFERIDEACVPVDVPDYAYLEPSGVRWSCERGYEAKDGECQPVDVPENGYLSGLSYNDGWACERGFKAVRNTCAEIIVPEHGYLSSERSGPGWKCERGYIASGDSCVSLNVPENAHIGYMEDRWECNKPYVQRGDVCVLP